jgi:hypothetical protein
LVGVRRDYGLKDRFDKNSLLFERIETQFLKFGCDFGGVASDIPRAIERSTSASQARGDLIIIQSLTAGFSFPQWPCRVWYQMIPQKSILSLIQYKMSLKQERVSNTR